MTHGIHGDAMFYVFEANGSVVLVAFARSARSRPTPVAPGLRTSAPSASRCALGVLRKGTVLLLLVSRAHFSLYATGSGLRPSPRFAHGGRARALRALGRLAKRVATLALRARLTLKKVLAGCRSALKSTRSKLALRSLEGIGPPPARRGTNFLHAHY